jgi:hypothetical protein
MLDDVVREKGMQEEVEVVDLAQMMLNSLEDQ